MWNFLCLRESNGSLCAGFNTMNEVKHRFLGANSSKVGTELGGNGGGVNEDASVEKMV